MAKSKSKAKSNGQSNNTKVTTKKKPPPPPAPGKKFLTCGDTGERVYVATATLADIQHPPANQSKRKILYKVPSAKTRTTLYDELALCLEDCESRRLPKYGGRPWQVICKVTDSSSSSSSQQSQKTTKKKTGTSGGTSPFFRWYRSKLELAVLPHLLERIPEPPKFPGYIQTDQGVIVRNIIKQEGCDNNAAAAHAEEEEEQYDLTEEEVQRMESLLSREISSLSQVAWDHRNDTRLGAPLPTVSLKWTCPLRQIFTSRKAAWDHALELAKAEQFVDRYLKGLGKNGAPLKPFRPTRSQALQVGKVRFLRDGLWVVGQEQAWQNERHLSIERGEGIVVLPETKRRKITGPALFLSIHRVPFREKRMKELKRKGGGGKTYGQPESVDKKSSTATLTKQKSKTAAKVGMPTPPPQKKPNRNRNGEINFSLVDSERELRGIWKNELTQEERNVWDTRASTSFQRRIDEDDHKRWDLAAKQEEGEEEDDVEACNEVSGEEEEGDEQEEDTSDEGSNKQESSNAKKKQKIGKGDANILTLASGRDRAIWEIFSEAEQGIWTKEASKTVKSLGEERKPPAATINPQPTFPELDAYQRRVFDSLFDKTPEEYEETALKNLRASDRRKLQAEHRKQKEMLAQGLKQLTVPAYAALEGGMEELVRGRMQSAKRRAGRKVAAAIAATHRPGSNKNSIAKPAPAVVRSRKRAASFSSSADTPGSRCDEEPELTTILPLTDPTPTAAGDATRETSSTPISPSPTLVDPILNATTDRATRRAPKDAPAALAPSSMAHSLVEDEENSDYDDDDEEQKQSLLEEEEKEEVPRFVPTNHYCLTEAQIKLCYDASMDHFDAVMRTVKARDLTRELVDGFDLLRERGRGRYDMELPVFDTKEFDFLNDIKKTPWMPIVRQVLGNDVVLIHKGCFLSVPDATNQKYHQDGLHLHTSSQRPCHAVNVFTPLVDMTMQHGPTEFCLGSHILGQEDWDRRFLETPLQKKGVPVMFDYRLGHRGLANTSKDPRPIVYCTYARASDGKEFRDSVNFSRRRYRKLGDLIDKPMSREERNKKRRESKEEWEDFPEAWLTTEG